MEIKKFKEKIFEIDESGQVTHWIWYLIPILVGVGWGLLGAYQIYLWS
jgi:hypothetical protein